MKTTSRYRILAAVLIGSLMAPQLALARTTGEDHAAPTASPRTEQEHPNGDDRQIKVANTPKVESTQLCRRIGDVGGSINDETGARFAQLGDDFNKRGGKISDDFGAAVAKMTAARIAADAERQKNFAKLEGKATTDAQKQAVHDFETAVLAAVTARRAAVDAANTAYKQAALAAITQRQTQLKTAATSYKTAVANAVVAAKASCAAGTAPATVRTTFQVALKTARTNLQAALQNANKVRPNLDAPKAARKAAIAQADATFKAAIAQALVALKAALPVASPSPSASPGA